MCVSFCSVQTPLFTYVLYLIILFTLGLMLQEMRSVYYLGIENVRIPYRCCDLSHATHAEATGATELLCFHVPLSCVQHTRNTYNLVNWLILSLYVASFTTRFIAQWRVDEAELDLCLQKKAKFLMDRWLEKFLKEGAVLSPERDNLLSFLNETKRVIDSAPDGVPPEKVKFYYFMQSCTRRTSATRLQ